MIAKACKDSAKGAAPRLPVSLVTTVLNDREGCATFFELMAQQTQLPDQIIIVDAGSTDGTWELLEGMSVDAAPWLIELRREAGCNIAKGRNLAIESAVHEIIVSTDIGCRWEPAWIEELVEPFAQDPDLEAVMGSWEIGPESISGWALVERAALPSFRFVATPVAHASSRSIAYRKTLWNRIGGYPEDLTLAGDDTVYAMLLHHYSQKTAAAPTIRVSWDRPTTLKAFTNEAWRNFYGAGEAAIWLQSLTATTLRAAAEIGLPIVAVGFLFSGLWPLGVGFAAAAATSFLIRLRRLRPAMSKLKAAGFPSPLVGVIRFDYAIRVAGIRSYWRGFVGGFRRCSACRGRLRAAGFGRVYVGFDLKR